MGNRFVPQDLQETIKKGEKLWEKVSQKWALTLDGRSLGQDGDGSLGNVLLLQQGAHFGAPRVRAHPQEVSNLICPLGGCKDLPVEKNILFTS